LRKASLRLRRGYADSRGTRQHPGMPPQGPSAARWLSPSVPTLHPVRGPRGGSSRRARWSRSL